MRCFDVLVLPSLVESVSDAIPEATASDVLAVATDVGVNTEKSQLGRCARLICSGHVAGTSNAMSAYLNNPSLRTMHDGHTRKLAISSFSMEAMIVACRNIYETRHRYSAARRPHPKP
jgi:glycosyltransferase involved in cell wall biosynthesis